jgi:SAM-dependent methyltransferase
MDAFEVVRDGYDQIGSRYVEWSRDNSVRLYWAGRLLDRLAPDSLVVELGCGAGEPATRLLTGKHRVVGVDASAVQLRLARQAAPAAVLIQADMTRLMFRPSSVDAVASFYALGHVPAARHIPLLTATASWLRPGGTLMTSVPLTVGDIRDDDWLGAPMFFGGIGAEATLEAVARVGLIVEQWTVVPEDEGAGRVVEFAWLIARKSSSLT